MEISSLKKNTAFLMACIMLASAASVNAEIAIKKDVVNAEKKDERKALPLPTRLVASAVDAVYPRRSLEDLSVWELTEVIKYGMYQSEDPFHFDVERLNLFNGVLKQRLAKKDFLQKDWTENRKSYQKVGLSCFHKLQSALEVIIQANAALYATLSKSENESINGITKALTTYKETLEKGGVSEQLIKHLAESNTKRVVMYRNIKRRLNQIFG